MELLIIIGAVFILAGIIVEFSGRRIPKEQTDFMVKKMVGTVNNDTTWRRQALTDTMKEG